MANRVLIERGTLLNIGGTPLNIGGMPFNILLEVDQSFELEMASLGIRTEDQSEWQTVSSLRGDQPVLCLLVASFQ